MRRTRSCPRPPMSRAVRGIQHRLRGRHRRLPRHGRAAALQPRGRAGRDRRPDRPVRVRQDHRAARGRGLRPAVERPHPHRRRATSPTCRPTPAGSAWSSRTTRSSPTCASRRTSPSASGRRARRARLVRERVRDVPRAWSACSTIVQRYPRELSRRTAAARRDRPRARHPAARPAARRAAVGARRADPPQHGRRARPAPPRAAGPDRALRHPRPDPRR